MLRWVIVLLALANAGYFVWTQGYLAPLGMAPADQAEPERLRAQVKPDTLRLLNGPKQPSSAEPPPAPAEPPATPADSANTTPGTTDTMAAGTLTAAITAPDTLATTPTAPASAPAEATPPPAPRTACWVAGGFTPEQTNALRSALASSGLPQGSWQLGEVKTGGRWVVYMGRYSDEQLEKKKGELNGLGVSFRALPPPLGPALALGTYSSEDAAQLGLQDVTKKGVRTARVVQERAEGAVWTLRLPAITEDQRNTVAGLRTALAGKRLQRCD